MIPEPEDGLSQPDQFWSHSRPPDQPASVVGVSSLHRRKPKVSIISKCERLTKDKLKRRKWSIHTSGDEIEHTDRKNVDSEPGT